MNETQRLKYYKTEIHSLLNPSKANLYIISPPQDLKHYVRYFWIMKGFSSKENPFIYRAMADHCTDIIFNYNNLFNIITPGNELIKICISGIKGPSEYFRRFTVVGNFGFFGASVYPFAIQKLFSIPCSILTNKTISLVSILGENGKELENRIMDAKNNFERINIFSKFLLERIADYRGKHLKELSALEYIIQKQGKVNIKELSNAFSLSTRQFERKFKDLSGFSPKLFSRITRFQSILENFNNNKSFPDIAFEAGFYDQSHFIRNFKEFSGYHPSTFFSNNVEANYMQRDHVMNINFINKNSN